MIDIENMVFDRVSKGLEERFPEANVTSAFVEEEAIFPCVTVRQKNCVPLRRTNTVESAENYATVTFEITFYSDKRDRSQSESRKLMGLTDEIMQEIGFRRIHTSEAFNISRTLTRRYTRYEAIIRSPIEKDGDTIYEVYRR